RMGIRLFSEKSLRSQESKRDSWGWEPALSPCFDMKALKQWLSKENTWYYCDTLMGLGDETLLECGNVNCQKRSSGRTRQAVERLNKKVLDNLRSYCGQG